MTTGATCARLVTIWSLGIVAGGKDMVAPRVERLTKRVVDAVKPEERDIVVWDSDIKGFALKVTAYRKKADGTQTGGKKVYFFRDRVKGDANKTFVNIGVHGRLHRRSGPRKSG
jgi:hypothetical protein